MSVQNVAIVFGPTLLRPEMEEASMPMTMVFQNQVVELILQQCADIFLPHCGPWVAGGHEAGPPLRLSASHPTAL